VTLIKFGDIPQISSIPACLAPPPRLLGWRAGLSESDGGQAESSIQDLFPTAQGETGMIHKQQFAIKDRAGNNGFTLIEVLVAIAIFAIGILALTSLQAVYIGGNSSARMQTGATTLATQWLERLKILPYAHDDLDPVGNPHRQVVGAYQIEWNVADNSPINEVKTIRITVTPANLRGRPVNLDYRRAEDWR
jgi:prepilin-type N-terminal cleavage/methylation domain-containing protein